MTGSSSWVQKLIHTRSGRFFEMSLLQYFVQLLMLPYFAIAFFIGWSQFFAMIICGVLLLIDSLLQVVYRTMCESLLGCEVSGYITLYLFHVVATIFLFFLLPIADSRKACRNVCLMTELGYCFTRGIHFGQGLDKICEVQMQS